MTKEKRNNIVKNSAIGTIVTILITALAALLFNSLEAYVKQSVDERVNLSVGRISAKLDSTSRSFLRVDRDIAVIKSQLHQINRSVNTLLEYNLKKGKEDALLHRREELR